MWVAWLASMKRTAPLSALGTLGTCTCVGQTQGGASADVMDRQT